ncbi:MAG: hypothetical protein WD904_11285 [Dehalococcoidia bacterium]
MTAPLPILRPYQAEAGWAIADSVFNNRGLTFSVVMARQAGKNELSAQIELLLLAKNRTHATDGVKCAPTFEPQCRLSMTRLWSRVQQAGLGELAVREDGRAVRFGRARFVFLSAEPGANVVGHTAGLLLEVDEAQDVDAEKFDRDFRPMASTTGATIVYYGTPWDESTLLERAAQEHIELERRDGIRRHFTADWATVAEHNPAYARYVEGERTRLGANHPLFLTQYALRPVPGSGRLFSHSQLAQLQGRHERQFAPRDGETYVAGLDIGGQDFGSPDGRRGRDNDRTVLTIARVVPGDAISGPRLEIVEHITEAGASHDTLIARLCDLLGEVWRVRRLTVDATGMGETIASVLSRRLGADVVRSLRISAEAKSRLGFNLLAAVNSGRLKCYAADGSPEYAAFWREAELARVAYRPGGGMSFHVDAADGHDDYLASLALVADAGRDGLPQPRVARGRTPVLA